jgi:hypothetical protein
LVYSSYHKAFAFAYRRISFMFLVYSSGTGSVLMMV